MLYAKKIKLTNDNDSLSQIYGFIQEGKICLDVGCATGALARVLSDNKKCAVYGLEVNAQSVEICQKSKKFKQVLQYDLNYLKADDFSQYQGFFDYIICADVLEHLLDPPAVLTELKKFLKPGGMIIISLPNVAHGSIKANLLLNDFTYTAIGILDKTHLHFYTYKNIAALLDAVELTCVDVKTVALPLEGWQPRTQNDLPKEVAAFIAKDKHSHIMQYVMLCKTETKNHINNLEKLEKVDAKQCRRGLKTFVKRLIITKMPKALKFFEYLRK